MAEHVSLETLNQVIEEGKDKSLLCVKENSTSEVINILLIF